MKRVYEIPELDVTRFLTSDVLTASMGDNDVDAGNQDWGWTSVDPTLGN